MIKEDRYTVIFDAGDWIVDTETGEYMGLEGACRMLPRDVIKVDNDKDDMECVPVTAPKLRGLDAWL